MLFHSHLIFKITRNKKTQQRIYFNRIYLTFACECQQIQIHHAFILLTTFSPICLYLLNMTSYETVCCMSFVGCMWQTVEKVMVFMFLAQVPTNIVNEMSEWHNFCGNIGNDFCCWKSNIWVYGNYITTNTVDACRNKWFSFIHSSIRNMRYAYAMHTSACDAFDVTERKFWCKKCGNWD